MTPDQLRALADALLPMAAAPCFDGIDVERAAAYLRAQADARPVPTAWRDPDTGELSRIGRVRWQPLYAHPAPAVPDGWKLVPVEPTPEMLSAVGMMDGYDWHAPGCSPDADHANWYSAMIAAAPAAPQAEPKRDNTALLQLANRLLVRYRHETPVDHQPYMIASEADSVISMIEVLLSQAKPIDPHMIVAEDRFPDVPAERWKSCPQCDGDFDRECPICDGLGKVLATDGEQAEPKPTPASGDDLGVYKGMADSYRNDAEQAEPKREPLTALRILEIEDEATRKWRDNGRIIEYAVVFTRLIEHAHDIGGSDE